MTKKLTVITIITSIFIALFCLILAVKITVNFRPLYYFDIDYLKITNNTTLSKAEIKENYDVLIDYLQPSYKGKLVFPHLPQSEEGEIHFEDVKTIFIFLHKLFYLSFFLSLIGIIYLTEHKSYEFYKVSSYFLFAIPLLLLLPLVIDFNTIFELFHKITFTNDYWMMDYDTDPIILLLPERFFMHCALLILLIMIMESILLNILYRFHIKRYIKNTTK